MSDQHATTPRRRVPVTGLLGALLLLVAATASVWAAAPRIVGALTDEVGVLESCREDVQNAQRGLFDRTGAQLYVVFVDSTDGVPMSDFVDQVIDGSNGQVTESDALFVVATEDRQYQLYTGEELKAKIGATEQDSLAATYIVPALRTSDWCAAATGAAVAVSNGLGLDAEQEDTPDTKGGGGIPSWLIIAVVLALVLGAVFWLVKGRSNHAVFKERAAQEDLGKQASSLLIATDDAMRAAEQELGFAQAQFGDAQAAQFQEVLDTAKGELRQAFLVSQKLDDDTPETPEQRHAMLQEVIDRCTRAKQMVADQMARIQTLRDLSKNIEQVLPQAVASVEAQTARIGPAGTVVSTLAARYAAENIGAVAGNPAAAEVRLTAAKASLDAANAALAANQRDAAVAKVQEAETAIGEATALLDAVETTRASLSDGEVQLTASIAAVQQDITQARTALSAGKGVERAAEVDRAEQLLAGAQTAAAATPLDIVAATRAVTEANTVIDGVLAGVQAADAAVARNQAAAQAALANATASVAQANALIAGSGVSEAGRRARTRVAEAQQYLARAQALLPTDAATAAQAAQTADALADEAIAEIQSSGPSAWPGPTGGYGGGGYGGGSAPAPSGGGGFLDSFLGAMLGGMMSGGGGGRNSGWGGGSGGFGGFGSGGFGGSSGGSGGSSRSSGSSHSGGGGGGGGHGGRRSGGGF